MGGRCSGASSTEAGNRGRAAQRGPFGQRDGSGRHPAGEDDWPGDAGATSQDQRAASPAAARIAVALDTGSLGWRPNVLAVRALQTTRWAFSRPGK
ncbi:MAG: hypothetical protein J7455_20490 [Roseiflexus sp.]|jgi:hypothetical protein|nr:hypothetical protein [Roseiflexus sp.]MBO9366549.1 hypothetical protein [Roseiflexus sp.]MBO9384043.1 hypothetical protein [Roseiflexus sp.]